MLTQGESMVITVKGYGSLKNYTKGLPVSGRLQIPEGTDPAHVFDLLEIPPDLPMVFFVNGRIAERQKALSQGDTVVFFSPMEGG